MYERKSTAEIHAMVEMELKAHWDKDMLIAAMMDTLDRDKAIQFLMENDAKSELEDEQRIARAITH